LHFLRFPSVFQNGRGISAIIPQGLKPLVVFALFGTTKVVP